MSNKQEEREKFIGHVDTEALKDISLELSTANIEYMYSRATGIAPVRRGLSIKTYRAMMINKLCAIGNANRSFSVSQLDDRNRELSRSIKLDKKHHLNNMSFYCAN